MLQLLTISGVADEEGVPGVTGTPVALGARLPLLGLLMRPPFTRGDRVRAGLDRAFNTFARILFAFAARLRRDGLGLSFEYLWDVIEIYSYTSVRFGGRVRVGAEKSVGRLFNAVPHLKLEHELQTPVLKIPSRARRHSSPGAQGHRFEAHRKPVNKRVG